MTRALPRRIRRPRPARSSGFATLTALGLVAIIGVGLAAMAAVFAGEVRRSARVRDDAQLRQLLLAGEVAARAAVARGGDAGEVELPGELKVRGAALALAAEGTDADGQRKLRVTARLAGERSMSQVLTYRGSGAEWTLHSAELD